MTASSTPVLQLRVVVNSGASRCPLCRTPGFIQISTRRHARKDIGMASTEKLAKRLTHEEHERMAQILEDEGLARRLEDSDAVATGQLAAIQPRNSPAVSNGCFQWCTCANIATVLPICTEIVLKSQLIRQQVHRGFHRADRCLSFLYDIREYGLLYMY